MKQDKLDITNVFNLVWAAVDGITPEEAKQTLLEAVLECLPTPREHSFSCLHNQNRSECDCGAEGEYIYSIKAQENIKKLFEE